MVQPTCPICGKKVTLHGETASTVFPFCSTRCRDADLGRWFSEQYTVPVETERVAREAELPRDDGSEDE